MKNNKMKKLISMMVAILVAFSALTMQASATWYEYDAYSSNQHEFSAYTDTAYGELRGDAPYVIARTRGGDLEIGYISAKLSWVTNVSPEFTPVTNKIRNTGGTILAEVDTNDYIASDYDIYAFTSTHAIYDSDDNLIDSFQIGTSYR